MEQSYEDLKNELDNLKKVVFRIMDFNFPDLNADIKHYDFITDEIVRRQLELDFLKMMQTPASNFNAYCLYSFFQIENLLNYYYTIRFNSKDDLLTYFTFGTTPLKGISRVSEIPYSSKWSKFAQEFLIEEKEVFDKFTNSKVLKKKPTPLNYDIQKIAYVRNSSIHRNTVDIDKYENEIYKKYLEIKSKQGKSQEEWKTYNDGDKIRFKKGESFSLVKKRTAEFLKIIENEIIKYQK